MGQYRGIIARELRSIIGARLGTDAERLPGGATLSSLGLGVSELMDVVNDVEYRFHVRGARKLFSENQTIDDNIALLDKMIAAGDANLPEPVAAEGAD